MTHKKVNNEDAGTSTLFGGNDLDKWSDWASGVDTDDYDINSDFTVRSAKRYLRNPANTFSYQEIASAITANRTVTEPLLTGNDTRVYQAHAQTLTNKTISGASNTLSSIPVNSISTFSVSAPTTNQVLQYNGTNWVNATSSGGGTGGTGGGFAAGGTITRNGGSALVQIPHGLIPTPDVYFALPLNDAARGNITYSVDATNINLTYPIAPASGTSNLSYVWGAGWIGAAVEGITTSSTTTMTNKTLDHELNTFPKVWSGYDYVIYKSGSTIKCRDMGLGTTVSTHASDASTVFNYALTNGVGKDIYVATGTYTPTTDFVFIGPRTRIKLSPGAIIQVPTGYTGNVWNLTRATADTTSLSNITIDGGQYQEAGTPSCNWDCIHISNTNGTTGTTAILFDRFMNMYIRHAGNGIRLHSTGDRGWINGNIFQNIVVDNAKTGILFDYAAGTVTEANGANRNQFHNFIMQCNTLSTVGGLIDVSGEGNIFNDCKIWDIDEGGAAAVSCNIHQRAEYTMFIGGIIQTQNFSDLGMHTVIQDVVTGYMYPQLKLPSRRKWGIFQGTAVTATPETAWAGILTTMSPVAGHTLSFPAGVAANGSCVLVTTPASGAAGWKSSRYVTMRDWRPRIKAKFRLTSATAVRMFIGFKNASADLTADNYLNANEGIGLGIDSTLTNFRLLRNDATGATVTSSSGVPVDTTLREIEIWYDQYMNAGLGGFNYKMQVAGSYTAINNTLGGGYTTDIPDLGTELRAVCQVGASTATTKGLELYYLEVESDK